MLVSLHFFLSNGWSEISVLSPHHRHLSAPELHESSTVLFHGTIKGPLRQGNAVGTGLEGKRRG